MEINLHLGLLRATAKGASTDYARPVLTNIMILTDGKRHAYITTDSYKLLIAMPKGDDDATMLPGDVVAWVCDTHAKTLDGGEGSDTCEARLFDHKELVDATAKWKHEPAINDTVGITFSIDPMSPNFYMKNRALRASVEGTDKIGDFPRFVSLLDGRTREPAPEPGIKPSFGAGHLMDVLKAANEIAKHIPVKGRPDAVVTMHGAVGDPSLKPSYMSVNVQDEGTLVALIMPVRVPNKEWFNTPVKVAKAS